MKKILLGIFAGLCIFGALIVSSNSSRDPYSFKENSAGEVLGDTTAPKTDTTKHEVSGLTFSSRILRDTTEPKSDTTKHEISGLAFNSRVLRDTTEPKSDTAKHEVSGLVFSNRILRDTTEPKPDTAKLVAYIR